MTEEKKEFGRWWVYTLSLIIVSIIIFIILGYFGKAGSTIVEREVFENSYQKVAGDNARNKMYRAQLASIEVKLRGSLDTQTRNNLLAQKAMLEIQLQGN